MKERQVKTRVSSLDSSLRLLFVSSCFLSLMGCLPCSDVRSFVMFRARLIDADTLEGLTDPVVHVTTLAGEEIIGTGSTRTVFIDQPNVPLGDGGSLELRVISNELQSLCLSLPGPGFPSPDQVEVVVTRGDCERRFMIDINEDTVVDVNFHPGGVIELKDPILVPPCQP